MSEVTIAGRRVGSGSPCLIIAELGGNAAQDYATAEVLVRAAAEAGADCVKTQLMVPSDLTLDSDAPPFRLTWAGEDTTLWALYSQTAMPIAWHRPLKALAESLGLYYFASVFSQAGIDFAVQLGLPCLKVSSFELTDLPLIRACWNTGLPLILSTGMATREEIEAPLDTIIDDYRRAIFLRCTSAYPAGVQDARLIWISSNVNWLNVGLSDHSRSNAVVAAAVALGACVVERHLKLIAAQDSPDSAFSDTPAEFAEMVKTIRDVEAALGTVHYGPTESEMPMLRFRRSLWAVADIKAGEVMTAEKVRCLRPADGLAPSEWDRVLGKRAKVDIARATALDWRMIE